MTKIACGSDWVLCVGHAGADEDGKIACDGITTLMHALEYSAICSVVKNPTIPYYYIHTMDHEKLELVQDGLRMLAEEFPSYINLSER